MDHLFEKVIVISLKDRLDRRERIKKMLDANKVRFSFFDGLTFTKDQITFKDVENYDVYGGQYARLFKTNYAPAAHGCRMSHKAVLEMAESEKWESVLILEDDFILHPNWQTKLYNAFHQLPSNWWQLYFCGLVIGAKPFSQDLKQLVRCWKTTAVAYNRRAYLPTIEALKTYNSEVDVAIDKKIISQGHSYIINPRIGAEDKTSTSSTYVKTVSTPK